MGWIQTRYEAFDINDGCSIIGVFIWTILGLDGADGVFPSVPGMGAAFITHFVMNYVRSPKVAPLGRFNLPQKKQYGAVAAAILIPFGAAEAI